MNRRITGDTQRGEILNLTVNGKAVSACAGETIATLLFAEHISVFYRSRKDRPRAPFCNMGTCFECQVKITRANSAAAPNWVRACMTPVAEGMSISCGEQIYATGRADETD